MKKIGNVAFIGTVGVPNNYGGFEMFLESCTPLLAHTFNTVFVTCDSTKYASRARNWHDVRRIFIPVSANGALSVIHDLLAFFAVFWRAQAIVVLGVSGGIFFPLFRVMCALSGKKLIVNVDGVEWRRAKFSVSKRAFLYVSDRLAQWCSHQVVVDNEGLRPFLARSVQSSAALIAYSGDHVTHVAPMLPVANGETRCLTICRIEPENNCAMLIEAFAIAGCGTYIFVGNWDASSYGRTLRQRYAHVPGLEMRDPVYEKNAVATLRSECTAYLHGHSVGGTNPSLVEMLFYDCAILAFDCSFNRFTAADAIDYFCDVPELVSKIPEAAMSAPRSRSKVRQDYTSARICAAYEAMIYSLFQQEVSQKKIEEPTKLGRPEVRKRTPAGQD
jgi:glycosyltransferase involved in cell wall biosynthesis